MAGELDAKVWSELPREVLELVLRCLPISILCKFRAVCKHWNTLPTIRPEDPYLLYIPRFVRMGVSGSCNLYSLIRNKWEVLDLSFVASYMAVHFNAKEPYVERVCSDGGLLCLMGQFVKRGIPGLYCLMEQAVDRRIRSGATHNRPRHPHPHYFSLVCNPLTRTLKLLPSFECHHIVDLVMHRDTSGVYKIFAAAVTYTGQPGILLHFYMYDSNSELWKRILTLKRDRGDITLLRSCSVVFNGVYYFVFGGILKDIHCSSRGNSREPFELHAYNMKQANWVVPGVKLMSLDDLTITGVSFVVSNERLLLSATSPLNVTWLYRLDGFEEMKLSETIAWRIALAYQDFILLSSYETLMIVNPANAKALKAVSVPWCNHPNCNCKASTHTRVRMAKASFNAQATLQLW